jgi:aromatic-L-amino-acid/L-tryptophan decarboxylase
VVTLDSAHGPGSVDELRKLAHRVADLVIDRHLHAGRETPGRTAAPSGLAGLDTPAPEEPCSPLTVLGQVLDQVAPFGIRADHPRNFGAIPSPADPVAAVADALATGLNLTTVNWTVGAAASQIELVTARWLAEALGMPPGSGGLFVSGGSMANLTAIAAAAHTDGPGVVYYGDQAHPTIDRALRVLGFGPAHRRVLPAVDERVDPEAVEAAIVRDRAAGLRPMMVIATAGTTNTGAVDPLDTLARLCRRHSLWFHVDGAYGAAAALTPRTGTLLRGLADADSITVDPHKWLFQPFGVGCLLLRDPGRLAAVFRLQTHYLPILQEDEDAVQLGANGLELTRPCRGFRLWFTIRTRGMSGLRRGIERGLDNADHLADRIRQRPDLELLTGPRLAITCFRHRADGDCPDFYSRLSEELLTRTPGFFVLPTIVGGRPAFRACTINPATSRTDIDQLIEQVTLLAPRITHRRAPGDPAPGQAR